MTIGILSLFITTVFSLSQVWGVRPNIFVPVSNATCQPDYAWMNNAAQRSPCLTVAYVIAACAGDTWTQPALPSGSSYDSPNGTTATPCYCSWSCYNLMMACTLCQNPAYISDITTWPSFSQNCPSNYKDQVFPQGYVLADNASIPYWATINPMGWSAELFDIRQAATYADQKQSDYWPSISLASPSPSPSPSATSSTGSSINIGAIIGGAVGGAAGLLILLVRCYFLRKRRQYRRLHNVDGTTPIPYTGIPMTNIPPRWSSDPSKNFTPPPSSSPRMSYLTTQPEGMNAGMNTISPPPVYSSVQAISLPPADTASFLTTENTAAQRSHAIPMV